MLPFAFFFPSGHVLPNQSDTVTTQAAAAVSDRRDKLITIFDRIENVFLRLETYIECPRTAGMVKAIVNLMAEVLHILAVVTKGIKEHRASELYLAKNMSPRLSNVQKRL